jgi:uncharacterized membrane protein SirB2
VTVASEIVAVFLLAFVFENVVMLSLSKQDNIFKNTFSLLYFLLRGLLQMCQTPIADCKILKPLREVSDTWGGF